MLGGITDWALGLRGWGALAVVFLLPALEASAFVGFLFPGELAVIVGGVLAAQHKVSLAGVLIAAVAGAVIGDSVGYELGKRFGRGLLEGSLGRLVPHHHLDRAEHYLAERGGRAVFLGRFTAALRVLIPGLAGMAGIRYRTFLAYNAAGGLLWAVGFVLAGYFAGDNWHHVEHVAGRASALVLLLAVLAVAVTAVGRWMGRHQQELRQLVDRQLQRPAVQRFRTRYARQVDFVGRRLRPREVTGLRLTAALMFLVAAGWTFGAVTQDVIAGDESARLDRPVARWFVDHREPWMTRIMQLLTPLGSSAVLVPVIVTVGFVAWRGRHSWRGLGFLAIAWAGSQVLFRSVKVLTHRARPPAQLRIGHFTGWSFPSGHATQSVVLWGAVAIVLGSMTTSWRRRVTVATAALAITITVGLTRLYLGAHWLTDVLAGWLLGACWLALLAVAWQLTAPTAAGKSPEPTMRGRGRGTPVTERRPDQASSG